MTTWETNVNEIVWESQTAPGITWTTVVGGTGGGTEIPARRLLPNTVGEPGQIPAVNEAGTAVEYVDAAPRPVDVTFVLVEPGLAFDPTTDPVQMVGAAYLFQGTEPSGDPDEGWEPWEHTGLWQGTSMVSNPSSVMTRLPHELRSGDSFHSHAMINLKELVDPPAGRSYPPYGTDTTTSRIAFINSIVVGEEQVASVDNPKFILLDEQSQPGFVQGQWKPRVITEDDEVGWLDKVIYADTSGGDISLDAAQLDDEPDSFRHVGRLLVVKNTGSGVLTITNIGTVAPLGEGESAWLHVTESAVEVIAAVSAGGGGGSGDVVGPSSATDGRPVVFDGTTGKLVKQGAVNSPDGLLRLNGSGVAPDTTLPGDLVRTSEMTTAITNAVSGVVADAINDGTTTVAPSQNAVFDALAAKAPIASPTFTGTPAAPTPAQGTNTTQLATTAYVQIEAGLLVPKSTVTTKGDLIVGTGSGAVTRRGIGSNGQVLTADSAQADGVKWAALTLQAPMVAGQDEGSTVSVGTSAVSLLDTAFAVPTDLVAGSALRLVAAMTYTQNGGGSYNWSWPVVLGSSTVLAAAAPSLGSSASLRWAWLDVMIRFEDVNDQNASGFLSLGSTSGAQLNSAPQGGGIAAENITLGKSLDLKVSTSVSGGTQQCTLKFATLTRFDP